MPHLQLDTAWTYPTEVKRELARRFGEVYGEVMQTSPDMVDVTIREFDGGVWRCGDETRPGRGAVVRHPPGPPCRATRTARRCPLPDHRGGPWYRSTAAQGGIHPARGRRDLCLDRD